MKRPRPDRRLDWRDPKMPVLRDYIMADGSIKHVVDPDYESKYREHMLTAAPHVSWKNDPVYNMRKK